MGIIFKNIVEYKKLDVNAKMPTRGSERAAGVDLYAASTYDIIIQPHQTVKVGTGIAVSIPHSYFGAIFARSGLATKKGLRPANAVGVVDSDYRGEVIVALHNDTNNIQVVEAGDRIAQLVLIPYLNFEFEEVEELDETERGEDGFGSTGR